MPSRTFVGGVWAMTVSRNAPGVVRGSAVATATAIAPATASGCGVGDLGGQGRLAGGGCRVVEVTGADGGDAHGGAVAPGALAVEGFAGEGAPVAAFADEAEETVGGRAVTAVEVVVLGERPGQGVLVDRVVGFQDSVDGRGHFGVVRPLPGARGERLGLEGGAVGGDEELGAERVAHGEGLEGGVCAVQAGSRRSESSLREEIPSFG